MAATHPWISKWPENLDFSKQSVSVPGTQRPGQTSKNRHLSSVFPYFTLADIENYRTLPQIFDSGLRVAGPKAQFLGHRPVESQQPLKFASHYVWQTWGEIDTRRRNLGSAIEGLFKSRAAVGTNGLDTIVDLATSLYGKILVPLYENFGPDSIGAVNHADLTIVFVQVHNVSALLSLSPKLPTLKIIVAMGEISPAPKEFLDAWSKQRKIRVMTLAERKYFFEYPCDDAHLVNPVEEIGAKSPIEPPTVTSETIATICYTSGTTGNPKGAILTQGALASATYSNTCGMDVTPFANPVVLSFLPLAHIYGRTMELCVTLAGGKIGYSTGSPLRILEDMQVLKPNFFPAVPRLLNRIYQVIAANLEAPGLKGALFRRAVAAKMERLKATGDYSHPLWDRLVFNKVRAALGGNVALVTSGSAPLNPQVLDFLRVVLACTVLQGYGMTENCGTCTRCIPKDPTDGGSVGFMQPVNEIKLIDVPSMGYTSEDKPHPRGEVCMRGANCFSGYYKNEQATKETIDEEGWVHTGDIGLMDELGRLKIIDRVKNIMKLSQGEYVALEKVENVYAACPVVQQIMVHGDSMQSYLLAVIVPDPVQLA
ncbi:acetyl-CoA synthetase-like protein, partial [Thelephora ganbajun]